MGKIYNFLIGNNVENCSSGNSLKNRLLIGGIWSVLSAVISRGLNLICYIFVARLLGEKYFGEFGIVLSTVGAVGSFAGLGLGMAMTKFVASLRSKSPDRMVKIIALSSILVIFTGLISGMLVFFISPLVSKQIFNNINLITPLRVSSGLIVFSVYFSVINGILTGFEALNKITRINTYCGLFTLPLIIYLSMSFGVTGAVLGQILYWIIACIMGLYEIKKIFINNCLKFSYTTCWEERRDLFNFAVPVALSSIIVVPATWYANVVLVRSSGYSEMGIFSASMQWQSAILFLPISFSYLVLALLSSTYGNNKGNDYFWLVKMSLFVNGCITGIITLFVCLCSKAIMNFYGEGFSVGWIILCILAINSIFIALNNVIGQVIASSASMWWGLILNSLWALIFIVASLLLVKTHGGIGLAFAYFIAYLFHMIWQSAYLYFIRIKNLKLKN